MTKWKRCLQWWLSDWRKGLLELLLATKNPQYDPDKKFLHQDSVSRVGCNFNRDETPLGTEKPPPVCWGLYCSLSSFLIKLQASTDFHYGKWDPSSHLRGYYCVFEAYQNIFMCLTYIFKIFSRGGTVEESIKIFGTKKKKIPSIGTLPLMLQCLINVWKCSWWGEQTLIFYSEQYRLVIVVESGFNSVIKIYISPNGPMWNSIVPLNCFPFMLKMSKSYLES